MLIFLMAEFTGLIRSSKRGSPARGQHSRLGSFPVSHAAKCIPVLTHANLTICFGAAYRLRTKNPDSYSNVHDTMSGQRNMDCADRVEIVIHNMQHRVHR